MCEHCITYDRTIWRDPDEWRRAHGGYVNLHPLFALVGCSIVNVRPDAMHIIDLGIAHYVLGSLFFTLCYFGDHFRGPLTAAARCDRLWGRTHAASQKQTNSAGSIQYIYISTYIIRNHSTTRRFVRTRLVSLVPSQAFFAWV